MNCLKPVHQTLIDQVIRKAKDDNRVIGVVLFGSSLLKSNYHDIDLCLIPNTAGDSTELFKEYLYSTQEPIDIRIFDELPLYIQVRVIKEGKILMQKNYDKIFQRYMDTLINWRDFEPHFQIYLEAIKHG